MRVLRLLLTALVALFAVFLAIAVFFGRLLGRSVRNRGPLRPVAQHRGRAVASSDQVIDVESTVVSADRAER